MHGVTWLLGGDPAVRVRVLRDLLDATPADVTAERRRVASEGWGARLLAEQNPDGGWGDGVYSPKWTSTTYTLLHLMWLGLPAGHEAAARGLGHLWAWQSRWRAPETCIESMLVRLTAAFDHPADRLDDVVEHLLAQQLDDGGWNCRAHGDATTHSSFHTSIQVLEALAAYRDAGGRLDTAQAAAAGQEFFLRHRLYRSHRTGAVAVAASTRFPAFPEWHFDVLRGLEHLASVNAPADERLADAVALVERRRRADGTWSTYAPYAGRHFFTLEEPGPSRWTTVRARAVLRWWSASSPAMTHGRRSLDPYTPP